MTRTFIRPPVLLEYLRPLPVSVSPGLVWFFAMDDQRLVRAVQSVSPRTRTARRSRPCIYGQIFQACCIWRCSQKPSAGRSRTGIRRHCRRDFVFMTKAKDACCRPGLRRFLDAGEPPIVFTLGSAAVMDARDFFDESAKAAKLLGRRAVLAVRHATKSRRRGWTRISSDLNSPPTHSFFREPPASFTRPGSARHHRLCVPACRN